MKPMKQLVLTIHRRLFARKRFARLHRALLVLSLKGLGFLNSESLEASGEAAFLQRLLAMVPATRPTILDVGAHKGSYANRIRQLSSSAVIYTFEPHPVTFQYLRRIAAHNSYEALNVAVGANNGPQKLYDYKYTPGTTHASLSREAIEQTHQQETTAWDVEMTTLDTFIETRGLTTIHLLKIDTEGHELNVLRGCQAALQRGSIDVIQFELSQMQAASRVFLGDFVELLAGYQLYRMLPNELVPLDQNDELLNYLYIYHNMVAVRQGCTWVAAVVSKAH